MDCQAWPLPIRPDRARQIVGSSQTQHLPKGDTPTHFEMLLGNGQDPLIAPIAELVARDVGTHILAEAPRFRKAKPLRAGPLGDKKKPLRQNLHHAAKVHHSAACGAVFQTLRVDVHVPVEGAKTRQINALHQTARGPLDTPTAPLGAKLFRSSRNVNIWRVKAADASGDVWHCRECKAGRL
jgi:hypothetical protein